MSLVESVSAYPVVFALPPPHTAARCPAVVAVAVVVVGAGARGRIWQQRG